MYIITVRQMSYRAVTTSEKARDREKREEREETYITRTRHRERGRQ